ncbi:MAG: N-acetyltransferase family protein [Microgenomates group bacterium]
MIRRATPKDAQALADLWNPWIIGTATTFNATARTDTEIVDMIISRPCFLVNDLQGIHGFVTYSQFRGGIGYARTMEHTIVLAPSLHGTGAGRTLMAAMEEFATAQGVHQMIAGVTAENPRGLAFHTGLGYETIATIRDAGFKFGRYIDLILMQKILS